VKILIIKKKKKNIKNQTAVSIIIAKDCVFEATCRDIFTQSNQSFIIEYEVTIKEA
jgi:hypothetical protein